MLVLIVLIVKRQKKFNYHLKTTRKKRKKKGIKREKSMSRLDSDEFFPDFDGFWDVIESFNFLYFILLFLPISFNENFRSHRLASHQ